MPRDLRVCESLCVRIEALAGRERAAIASGDYAALAALVRAREAMSLNFADAAARAGPDAGPLADRALAAARATHEMLEAALRGARRGRERLHQIAEAGESMGVYTASGARPGARRGAAELAPDRLRRV